jgi:hypothetical protein
MKIAVFWVVAPCSLVEVYQRFRGPCCLHLRETEDPEDSNLQECTNIHKFQRKGFVPRPLFHNLPLSR